jgi:hypothetical protein
MPAFAASCSINSSILPRLLPVACRIVVCDFILIRCDMNYKRGARAKGRFTFNREPSVAAMQEQARNSQQIAAAEMSVLIREHQITPKPVGSHCEDPAQAPVNPR